MAVALLPMPDIIAVEGLYRARFHLCRNHSNPRVLRADGHPPRHLHSSRLFSSNHQAGRFQFETKLVGSALPKHNTTECSPFGFDISTRSSTNNKHEVYRPQRLRSEGPFGGM